MRMRRRPDTHILPPAPIQQIMPAFAPRTGKIADFVMIPSRRRQLPTCGIKLLALLLLVNLDPLGSRPTRKRSVRLNLQAVAGNMLRPQRHRFRKAGAKGSGRSVRNPVNQVQAEVLETRRARQLHGRRNRGGIMNAPQPPQRGIVERLRANRKPVHPRPPQPRRLRRRQRARIRLARPLRHSRQPDTRMNQLQQPRQRRLRQFGRRAAADKHRFGNKISRQLRQLARDAPQPRLRRPRLRHPRKKRAIRTLARAKRNVNIQPRTHAAAPRQRISNSRISRNVRSASARSSFVIAKPTCTRT